VTKVRKWFTPQITADHRYLSVKFIIYYYISYSVSQKTSINGDTQ